MLEASVGHRFDDNAGARHLSPSVIDPRTGRSGRRERRCCRRAQWRGLATATGGTPHLLELTRPEHRINLLLAVEAVPPGLVGQIRDEMRLTCRVRLGLRPGCRRRGRVACRWPGRSG